MASDVRHCPRCELRFTNTNELQDHFAIDHAADPDTFSRFRYPAASAARPQSKGRRLLLVGNQTLEADYVLDEMIRCGTDARVFVLVPATHSGDLEQPLADRPRPGSADADDVGVALARWRLRRTIDRLRAEGVDAEGQVGHPDPLTAVTRLLRSERFDEIVLSTLPPAASRWLQADLPARLERRCGVTVRTIVAAVVR